MLSPVAEEQIEPEDTHPTPAMQQRSDVTVLASTPFGNSLVQHVCRNMSDTQAHEAVMNKTWFRQVADQEATHLQQKMSPSRRLSMTIPAWASKKRQGDAALWSNRKDSGTGPASSSFGSTPSEEDVTYPLHEMLQPSLQNIEAFLADEKKEKEQVSAKSFVTMSRHMPSTDSDSSSSTNQAWRKKDDEEYYMHAWSRRAKLMRKTLKATGRVAMETSTDRAFVRRNLQSFASHALEGSSFSPSHAKRMHAFMLPCVEVDLFLSSLNDSLKGATRRSVMVA